MDARAVEQAKEQLERAEQALETLKAADDYKPAERAWADFILAASTVYSKLEQGAKSDGKSNGWFGRKKKERKDDPLLRYLHFARNGEEHGIDRVVARVAGNKTGFKEKLLKFGERIPVKVRTVDKNRTPTGPEVDASLDGPSIKLVRVYDRRFNDHCDPPKEHLGERVSYSGTVPSQVGELGLAYLKALVGEAEALVPVSKTIIK